MRKSYDIDGWTKYYEWTRDCIQDIKDKSRWRRFDSVYTAGDIGCDIGILWEKSKKWNGPEKVQIFEIKNEIEYILCSNRHRLIEDVGAINNVNTIDYWELD